MGRYVTDAEKIARKLRRVIKEANEKGYTVFVSFHGGLKIVPTEEYDGCDDLRRLDGESVDLDTCDTPVMPSIDASGNG